MKKLIHKAQQQTSPFVALLRAHGYRATPGKITLLQTLTDAKKPLSIGGIIERIDTGLDQATIYRAVETLADAGILRRVDFQHSHAHYEIIDPAYHHHHLICRDCGAVEDVELCQSKTLEKKVLEHSKKFREISAHSLEFFGRCVSCSPKGL